MLSIFNTPNFLPFGTIAVTSSSGSSTSGTFINPKSILAESVMVSNTGSTITFVAFGDGSATAFVPTTETLNATPVAAGAIMVLKKTKNFNTVACISASGSGTVYFTAGEGQ